MLDVVTYALCKKLAKSAISGIKNIEINGTTMTIITNDGGTFDMVFPTPEDGISITDIKIDENNHLICTLSDNSEIDAGELPAGSGGSSKENSAIIEFDSVNDTFAAPIDDTLLNIYVNGIRLAENSDYTIDTSTTPNQIIFSMVYDDYDECVVTWIESHATGDTCDGGLILTPYFDEGGSA